MAQSHELVPRSHQEPQREWKSITTDSRKTGYHGERTLIGRTAQDIQQHRKNGFDKAIWDYPTVQMLATSGIYGDTDTEHFLRLAVRITLHPEITQEQIEALIARIPKDFPPDIPILFEYEELHIVASGQNDTSEKPQLVQKVVDRQQASVVSMAVAFAQSFQEVEQTP